MLTDPISLLNMRGCDQRGIYRENGSALKVKEYRDRFDKGILSFTSDDIYGSMSNYQIEHDINLFDEPNLFDVNIIASLFKQWLRDLPDEILPKETQKRLSAAHGTSEEAPQMLKDELSMLSPWRYYLLFAITCHLSLLLAYTDKNMMSFGNLQICFITSLNIDNNCFRWLVADWRNCWQGCWTEKEALVEEYRILDGLESRGADSSGGSTAVEDRSLASSGSGKLPHKPPPLTVTPSSQENLARNEKGQHLPELSLAPPLSPIDL